MPVGHLHDFFGKMPTQLFCSVFDCVVCFFGIELREISVYF